MCRVWVWNHILKYSDLHMCVARNSIDSEMMQRGRVRANIDRTSCTCSLLNTHWIGVFSCASNEKIRTLVLASYNTQRMIIRKYVGSTTYEWVHWWNTLFPFCFMYQLVTYHESSSRSKKKKVGKERHTMKNYYNDAHIPHEFQFCSRHSQYFVVQASEQAKKNPMKGECVSGI